MNPPDPRQEQVRLVSEIPEGADPIRWVHPEWRERFPWLAQGTTGRGGAEDPADFAMFPAGGPPRSPRPWLELARELGFSRIVHARQVHGAGVGVVRGASGLAMAPDRDGHASRDPGVLLGITVADCVPVFLVDPNRRAVALLHAGWRGVASGVLEAGVAVMGRHFATEPGDLYMHLGPAICEACYEVGPEVHEGLGLPRPDGPETVDLRHLLSIRALQQGIAPDRTTRSSFCTRCHGDRFFSHRGGDPGRQVGFLGIRPRGVGLCGSCCWVKEIRNRRGSRFLLCRRSGTDPSFARYPELPVLQCRGYESTGPPSVSEVRDAPPEA